VRGHFPHICRKLGRIDMNGDRMEIGEEKKQSASSCIAAQRLIAPR
jgi:hypothetical protein